MCGWSQHFFCFIALDTLNVVPLFRSWVKSLSSSWRPPTKATSSMWAEKRGKPSLVSAFLEYVFSTHKPLCETPAWVLLCFWKRLGNIHIRYCTNLSRFEFACDASTKKLSKILQLFSQASTQGAPVVGTISAADRLFWWCRGHAGAIPGHAIIRQYVTYNGYSGRYRRLMPLSNRYMKEI